MEIILFVSAISAGAIAVYFFKNKEINNLKFREIKWQENEKFLQENLAEKKSQIVILEEENSRLSNYQGRFEQAKILIEDLKLQIENYKKELTFLNNKIADLGKEKELFKQERDLFLKEKQEWSVDKENIVYQLSEKLSRKNSEEQTKFGEIQQEIIKKTTENLFKNFEEVLNKVSSLDDDVKKSVQDISLTKNALLNPGGAGRTSEITLENILKASNLKEKFNILDAGDFILQSHFAGADKSGKRPDAIVFLPDNRLWIIDSKSSSHFLDLERAKENKDAEQIKEISSKIKDSMKKHLEDLKKKDYAKSKLEEFDLQNLFSENALPQISTIMFLQTEKMLEIVNELDSNFIQKAFEAGIWPVGPVGLINLLNQAKFIISKLKQDQNIEQLKIEIKKLIDSVLVMSQKSKEMGKAIHKATKAYDEFAGSFNNRFLSRINNVTKLGIESDKKTSIGKLERYHIAITSDIIEGDVISETVLEIGEVVGEEQ